MHKRRIYDILDLFSDVGGVTQLLVIVFTIILQPIFYHKQMLQILKYLYFAKTIDANVFDDGIKKQSIVNKSDPAMSESTL